jgi:hypothetical protein
VAGVGDNAYLFNTDTGRLEVFDLTTPNSPQLVGNLPMSTSQVAQLVATDDHLFVANGAGGVRVIDITTPSAPVEVAFYATPSEVRWLVVAGELVYAAATDGGLLVLRWADPTALDEEPQPQRQMLRLPALAN